MDSVLTDVFLPLALVIVMLGVGLSLEVTDFARVAKYPKAVLVALTCQLLVMPAVCFGLVIVLDLSPVFAVGMMLLAASPGGTTANLFSHLFRGDVALNVTLTAVNSVVAVFTLPVVTNFAIGYFEPVTGGVDIGLNVVETLKVFLIVLVPVAVGMLVRRRSRGFAERMDRPVRIASAVILAVLVIGIMVDQRENLLDYLARLGPATAVFCLISMCVGYFVPRMLGVSERQSIASSMEIGVHNGTLAIAIATTVLQDIPDLEFPAAVYSLVMFFMAAAFGWLITRGRVRDVAPAVRD